MAREAVVHWLHTGTSWYPDHTLENTHWSEEQLPSQRQQGIATVSSVSLDSLHIPCIPFFSSGFRQSNQFPKWNSCAARECQITRATGTAKLGPSLQPPIIGSFRLTSTQLENLYPSLRIASLVHHIAFIPNPYVLANKIDDSRKCNKRDGNNNSGLEQ